MTEPSANRIFSDDTLHELTMNWFDISYRLELAEDRGDSAWANDCRERLDQIDNLFEVINS